MGPRVISLCGPRRNKSGGGGESREINSGEELELLRYRGRKIYRQFRGILSLTHSRFTGFTATPRGRGRSFVLLNRTDTHITRVRLKIGGGGSTCSFLIRVYINADEWASGIKFGTKMRPFVEGERNDDANAFRFDGTTVRFGCLCSFRSLQ